MTWPSALPSLGEALLAEKLHQHHIRGLMVLDNNSLPVASTIHNPSLEQQLCGLAAKVMEIFEKTEKNLEVSRSLYLWLAGVERHLAFLPLTPGLFLLAICDPAASPNEALIPLLSFSQRLAVQVLAGKNA